MMRKPLAGLVATVLAATSVALPMRLGRSAQVDKPRERVALPESSASCSQAQAFYSRLATPPTFTRTQYDRVICGLAATGTLAKLDGLYKLGAENQAMANTNLVGSHNTLTVVGTVTFGPLAGYMGDAETGYLDTGFMPNKAIGAKYSKAGESIGVVLTDTRQAYTGWTAMGASNSDCTGFSYIKPGNGGQNSLSLGTGKALEDHTVSAVNGVWIGSRIGAMITFYHDGVVLATGRTAASLPATPILIGALNLGCEGKRVADQSGDSIAWAFFGGGLNAKDINALTTLLAAATSDQSVMAAAWGFTSNKFSYNFATQGLSGIDVEGSKKPGYQFYNSFWFGCAAPTPCGGSDSARASALAYDGKLVTLGAGGTNARIATRGSTSSAFSATASGTTLTVLDVLYGPLLTGQVVAGHAALSGQTIVRQLTGSPGGVGSYQLSAPASILASAKLLGQSSIGMPTFPAGGYYEATFSLDPLNDKGNNGWPAFWLHDIAGLYSQVLTAGYGEARAFGEIDIFEAKSGARGASMNIHHWTNVNGGGSSDNLGITNTAMPQYYAAIANRTGLHSYGMLWVPTMLNGGSGFIQFFLDRVPVNNKVTYSASSAPWLITEGGNFVLLFDSGGGTNPYPVNLQSVNVWHR